MARDYRARCDAQGLAPAEIRIRRDRMAAAWQKPEMATAEAVEKHWDDFAADPAPFDQASRDAAAARNLP